MQQENSKVESEALETLKVLQRRDYKQMDYQMNLAKDDNIRDMSFGRWALSVPTDHFKVLSVAFPQLTNTDAKIVTRAWKEFMKHPLCLPYKINSKLRSM